VPRRLITLVSTEGKTPEQLAFELSTNQAKFAAELAKHTLADPAKK
jgi:hypothetical protein